MPYISIIDSVQAPRRNDPEERETSGGQADQGTTGGSIQQVERLMATLWVSAGQSGTDET